MKALIDYASYCLSSKLVVTNLLDLVVSIRFELINISKVRNKEQTGSDWTWRRCSPQSVFGATLERAGSSLS